ICESVAATYISQRCCECLIYATDSQIRTIDMAQILFNIFFSNSDLFWFSSSICESVAKSHILQRCCQPHLILGLLYNL
ncbi:MAG: hypothetical protein PSX81_12305, partial [bacterium]|nr:hypothetical protein [bacterium]